jgi:hypothetical protein
MSRLRTTIDDFIRKATNAHGARYDYSKVLWAGTNTKVLIICKEHGEFIQWPNDHIKGFGCPMCSGNARMSLQSFLEKAYAVHTDTYDYSSITGVRSNKDKVPIACAHHGVFVQSINAHLGGQGCPKCGIQRRTDARRKQLEQFIQEARLVHGDKYRYTDTIYHTALTKLTITCPKHGAFLQTPNSHINGSGCPRCAYEANAGTGHWSFTKWEDTGSNSTKFDSYKLYVLYCYNEHEAFIKIGKTFHTINRRYNSCRLMPYMYKVLFSISSTARVISIAENTIHKLLRPYSYTPMLEFGGMYECFTVGAIQNLIKGAH